MRIIGIIAEYNPFHNGHAYQIKKIKEELQADYVVIAMSGDFVQRGTPAIIDKYARTKMALSCGADLIIELPVLWATASAEYFAMAGAALFEKIGCVDGICFGAETEDLALLSQIADVLIFEPEHYRTAFSSYLKDGLTFPAARSKALCEYFSKTAFGMDSNCNPAGKNDPNAIASILNEPNNILAIEYLKALKRRNSSMTPYVIKRKGAGYHEDTIRDISDSADTDNGSANTGTIPAASATAIRSILENSSPKTSQPYTDVFPFTALTAAMPAPALEVLKTYAAEKVFLQANDFSLALGCKLLAANTGTLADIGDSNPCLSNRLFKNRMNFSSFEQFCELNKSKDMTYARISRVLLHFILRITNQDYTSGKAFDYIPYIRMLGFRKDASALLKIIKTSANVPMIAKPADASSLLISDALVLFEKDIFAADLYELACANKIGAFPSSDYTRNIIIL